MSGREDDLNSLKAALKDHAEPLLLELFGEPTSRTAREWRWGAHGSVSCDVRRGVFFSFEMEQGGSLVDAIMLAHGLDFSSAVVWARDWLGDGGAERIAPRTPPKPAFDADAERQRTVDASAALWRRHGRRIEGTAAEKYLRGRAIDRWPDDCARFVGAAAVRETLIRKDGQPWSWWPSPAIVFPVRNAGGDVVAVQLVALQDDGVAVVDEGGRKLKRSSGPVGEGAVRFAARQEGGPLLLAEGPETGLSLWLATGLETWSNLGSIAKAPLASVPLDRLIVACQDDDKRWSTADPKAGQTRKKLKEVVRKWRREGRTVVVATPWRQSRQDKSDFNDVLQREGVDAVRARIEAATTPARHEPGIGANDAGAELQAAIGKTVDELLKGACASPAVIRATLGLGKSRSMLEVMVPLAARGVPAVIAVPTHRLAADLVETAHEIGVRRGASIGVWRGREQPDPSDEREKMCRNLDVAKLAQEAGLNVGEAVCATCKHREECGYLKQAGQMNDVWIVAHGLLFSPMPKEMEATRLLVVDEDVVLASIEDEASISLPELREPAAVGAKRQRPYVKRKPRRVSWQEALAEGGFLDLPAELKPLHEALATAVESHPTSARGEYLSRGTLLDAGITRERALQAAQLNRSRIGDASILKELSPEEREAALKALKPVNALAAKLTALWGHVSDLLADTGKKATGRIRIVEGKDGVRELRMQGVKRLGERWEALPALHLDATADLELSQVAFPDAWLAADIKASEPHVRYHQVIGKSFGKGALVELPDVPEKQKATVRYLRDDVRKDILRRIAGRGGAWLVVTHKAVAELWREKMPPNVAVEWFGNLRGLNAYSDVDGIFIVGRWGTTPYAVETQAAALTGRPVQRVDGFWFPQRTVTLGASDGTMRSVEVDEHPDSFVEAVRQATVAAELVQATGRGRGVRRTQASPLEVTVFGNVVLPVELATLTEWTAPGFDDGMLGELGVVLENASDAAQVAGISRSAVKMARRRLVTNAYSNISYRECDQPPGRYRLGYARYQRIGAGRSEASITFDTMRVMRPGKWLAAHLGPVTLTALHRPDRSSARAPVKGMVACQVSGHLNFGFAPTSGVAWGDVQDDRLQMIESTMKDNMNMATMDALELLDQIEAETSTNPEWFGTLVSIGTDHVGLPEDLVRRVWSNAAEARALAGDESQSTERRTVYSRLGEPLDDVILGLALVGQRVVNECVAIAAVQRAPVTL